MPLVLEATCLYYRTSYRHVLFTLSTKLAISALSILGKTSWRRPHSLSASYALELLPDNLFCREALTVLPGLGSGKESTAHRHVHHERPSSKTICPPKDVDGQLPTTQPFPESRPATKQKCPEIFSC